MRDECEESDESVGKGEISTLLTIVPGLAVIGTLCADVAMFVAFEAALDTGAAALVESVTEGVLNVVGGVLEAVLDILVVALFRAHAGMPLWKGAAESAMLIAVLEVGGEANLVGCVFRVEMVAGGGRGK